MKVFGWVVATIIGLALASVWNGYALSILWGWFVAPLFGAPLITIPQAIGLAMAVAFVTHQREADGDPGKDAATKFAESMLYAAIKPVLALLFGWIVTLFM